MTLQEVCSFVARYRPDWDDAFASKIIRDFDLDPTALLSEMSKGQRAKVSLLLALAFHPQLLILDEPTSGLDPRARRQFFEGVLANFQAEGGTILVSSHLINEISGAVDYVGILREGNMPLQLPLESL